MTTILMIKPIEQGTPKRGHLLEYITPNKQYTVLDTWTKHKMILDDIGNKVWISGNMQKKYFKEYK